ncbi:MAG TPA: hypothetical protein VMS00_00445 [Acidimicrobiales bacterium]|nr:hypothetical protein [Acidimicrobiales bacterium]
MSHPVCAPLWEAQVIMSVPFVAFEPMETSEVGEATTRGLASWPELLELANDALQVTSRDILLPELSIAMPLEVGHASVARTRQLLAGLVVLVDAGLLDICGTLTRPLYETWLVGMYGLLGGPDALESLGAQQDKSLAPLLAVLGKTSQNKGQGLSVEGMAGKVSDLMRERGMPNRRFAKNAYGVVYRFQSYRDVHGGLGSIEGHIDRHPGHVVVLRQRPDDDAFVRHGFLLALAIFISGAQIVAKESGFDHQVLDELGERVHGFAPKTQETSME